MEIKDLLQIRVVRNGLSGNVTCTLNPEGFNGVNHDRYRGRSGPGKDSEPGKNLAHLKK